MTQIYKNLHHKYKFFNKKNNKNKHQNNQLIKNQLIIKTY